MSDTQFMCPCGKPVERRKGAGRPPRQCLDCRQPYRDRKKVKAEGAGYSPVTVKAERTGGISLADLLARRTSERVPFVMPEVPMKAVIPERLRGTVGPERDKAVGPRPASRGRLPLRPTLRG